MRLYSNILNLKIDFFTVKDDMFALVSNKRGEAKETDTVRISKDLFLHEYKSSVTLYPRALLR